jgi:RPA family protein
MEPTSNWLSPAFIVAIASAIKLTDAVALSFLRYPVAVKRKPSKGGRPRTYKDAGFISLRGERAEIEELKAFARWRAYTEKRAVSAMRAVLDAVKESPKFREFQRRKN